MIGSGLWLEQTKRDWAIRCPGRSFDPAKAFRSAALRELSGCRPRTWRGVLPWRLHDYEDHSALDATFTAYLDVHLALYDWGQRMFILTHQPLDWWAERLAEVGAEVTCARLGCAE